MSENPSFRPTQKTPASKKTLAAAILAGMASISALAAGCQPTVDAKDASSAVTTGNDYGNREGTGEQKVTEIRRTKGAQEKCDGVTPHIVDLGGKPTNEIKEDDPAVLDKMLQRLKAEAVAAETKAACYEAATQGPAPQPTAAPAPATTTPKTAPTLEPTP